MHVRIGVVYLFYHKFIIFNFVCYAFYFRIMNQILWTILILLFLTFANLQLAIRGESDEEEESHADDNSTLGEQIPGIGDDGESIGSFSPSVGGNISEMESYISSFLISPCRPITQSANCLSANFTYGYGPKQRTQEPNIG